MRYQSFMSILHVSTICGASYEIILYSGPIPLQASALLGLDPRLG